MNKKNTEIIAIVVSIATLLLLCYQIAILSKEVREQKEAQRVCNLISLNQQMYPCPRINEIFEDMVNNRQLLNKHGGKYSQIEVDNFLGYFEMIGIIEEYDYLDLKIIDDMFGYDAVEIFKNNELVEYINSDRNATWPFLKQLNKKIEELNHRRNRK